MFTGLNDENNKDLKFTFKIHSKQVIISVQINLKIFQKFIIEQPFKKNKKENLYQYSNKYQKNIKNDIKKYLMNIKKNKYFKTSTNQFRFFELSFLKIAFE